MLIGRVRWVDAVASARRRHRQPWVLTGVLIVMLGGTWVMQGLDVVDGAFFGNRLASVLIGAATACAGLALVVGLAWTRGFGKPEAGVAERPSGPGPDRADPTSGAA